MMISKEKPKQPKYQELKQPFYWIDEAQIGNVQMRVAHQVEKDGNIPFYFAGFQNYVGIFPVRQAHRLCGMKFYYVDIYDMGNPRNVHILDKTIIQIEDEIRLLHGDGWVNAFETTGTTFKLKDSLAEWGVNFYQVEVNRNLNLTSFLNDRTGAEIKPNIELVLAEAINIHRNQRTIEKQAKQEYDSKVATLQGCKYIKVG